MGKKKNNSKSSEVSENVFVVSTMLMILSAFAFLFCLFMPNRWHCECLGKVVKHSEGTYVVVDDEAETAQTFENMVVYKTKDGNIDTVYYGSLNRATELSVRYVQKNAWAFAYRYRWWTNCLLYLACTLVSLFLLSITSKDVDVDDKKVEKKFEDDIDLKDIW